MSVAAQGSKCYLFIYGNSGLGKGLLYDLDICGFLPKYREVIFVNDYFQADVLGHRTVCFAEALEIASKHEADYIVAVGEPLARKKLFDRCLTNKCNVVSVNGSMTKFHNSVTVGKGTIVRMGSIVDVETVIGLNCFVNKNVSLGHNVVLGNNCSLAPGVVVGGFSKIGDSTYVGSGAVIRDRIVIGSNCIVGMGSVVTKNIPDNSIVFGNPATLKEKNYGKNIFKKSLDKN